MILKKDMKEVYKQAMKDNKSTIFRSEGYHNDNSRHIIRKATGEVFKKYKKGERIKMDKKKIEKIIELQKEKENIDRILKLSNKKNIFSFCIKNIIDLYGYMYVPKELDNKIIELLKDYSKKINKELEEL